MYRKSCGFTLTELLIVILIVGILAAIALPQYQKAVEKSKAMQGIALLRELARAQQVYYLRQGKYASKFADLEVNIPWTGNTKFLPTTATDTKSNKDWSFQIEEWNKTTILYAVRISGIYKGAGFSFTLPPTLGQIECMERISGANFLLNKSLGKGAYCEKLFHGRQIYEDSWTRSYLF